MNKSELIDTVSKTTSLTKGEADEAVNALIHAVVSEVKSGRRVVVASFGSFNPTRRGARMGRNPQTGAPVAIAASRGVRFGPSAMLKDVLNGKAVLPRLKPLVAAGRTSKAPKAAKKASRVAKKTSKKAAQRSMKKVVRRVPAKKAAKRAPARKAAKHSARKAVRRVPARSSSKRAPARKAAKRSARRP